jgi:heat shock protein HtpX
MNREELEGVLAHELSHIQNQDIKIMTLVGVLFGLVAMVSDIVIRTMFWSSISGGSGSNRKGGGNAILLIIAVIFVILSPIIALLIQMTISRNREYLADSNAAKLTRYPQGLANALRKISKSNKSVKYATKGTAHFYISNPLKTNKKRKINLFSTHPPLEKRIEILESM